MKKYISLLVGAALATSMSCEVLDMDVQENPNQLTPDQYDLNAYLNSIQISLGDFLAGTPGTTGASEYGMEVTRMNTMFGPLYTNAYTPAAFNFMWNTAYAGILKDGSEIIRVAEEDEFYDHAAIAKIIQSYVLVTLVDYFGDIPYTEALQGVDNFNPGVTSDEEVYSEALRLLNEAIDDLNRDGFGKPQDLYYGGDMRKWEALANTLKLRIYVQTKHVNANAGAEVANLLATANIIDTPEEDFQFKYSTNRTAPDSRHPEFSGSYDNGADDYMANYFMNLLIVGRTYTNQDNQAIAVTDPRIRYYFYRQNVSNRNKNEQSLPCVAQTRPTHYRDFDPFCSLPSGYWGRDHGNNDGLPPDDLSRTIWGLYPFGGEFDYSYGGRGRMTSGAQGAGIQPIMLSSYVYFLRAEAALTMGTGEDARELLRQGVEASLNKVLNFGNEVNYSLESIRLDEGDNIENYIPSDQTVENYITAVMEAYDDSAEGQLEVVMEEFYKALFGNGVDAYNAYRRTGYPDDLQPTLEPSPGPFIYSFLYPSDLVNRNVNVSQKPMDNSVKVFWDPGLDLN